MSGPPASERELGLFAKVAVLVGKDLRIESRGRDTLPPMLAFSVAVTLLLAFTLPGAPRLTAPGSLVLGTVPLADVLAGFLWVTILFAGLIGFGRTFEVERTEGAIDSLLLLPIDRSGLFLAKAFANLTFVATVEIVLLPVFGLLFGFDLGVRWFGLALVTILVDIGFVAIGTLFAGLASQTRSRELVLPILALPALVPLFIAAVELTSGLFLAEGLSAGWFAILIASDVIFSVVGALAFEFVLD
ncbi:MAG: heme exporter protein [Actinomycetota bacterium]|nr:heme exporter protein [Actinomycetota bacterium]